MAPPAEYLGQDEIRYGGYVSVLLTDQLFCCNIR
jgi:hypothetical protein